MNHLALFNGQGGFQLAAQWAGWQNVASVEIDDFCNRVTNYYYPNCTQYGDIHTVDFTPWRGRVDVISGGFPCQPYSHAGQRKGTADKRHLWPQMLRAVRDVKPRWVVAENVPGLISWAGGLVFQQVCLDLEAEGYEVCPFVLPAAGKNAPHRRDRVWIVAHRGGQQPEPPGRPPKNDDDKRQTAQHEPQGPGVWGGPKPDGATRPAANAGCQPGNGRQNKQPGNGGHYGQNGQGYQAANNTERLCPPAVVTNAHNGNPQTGVEQFGQNGQPAVNHDCGRHAANANKKRRGQQHFAAKPGEQGQPAGVFADYWQNWPTQPPVCDGYDGLPAPMDAITVPGRRRPRTLNGRRAYAWWRNKSLISAGNAIVPQVAHSIFMAINQFEELLKTQPCH